MSSPSRYLEPVELDRGWVEASYQVHEPRSLDARTDHRDRDAQLRSGAPDRLRVAAVMVWYAWLILAGVVVGGAALAVLARVAFVVLRWTVSP
jgi:hypothetical protein